MKKYTLSVLLCFLVLPLLAVKAQEGTTEVPEETLAPEGTEPMDQQAILEGTTPSAQKQCYEMLKEDMADAGVFAMPLQTLQDMSYTDISTEFSRKYKGLMSFGDFEISEANVETRVYSFGEQTGYIHPPLSPYPVSTETEMWDEPAKQYIVVEEYINEPAVGSHFMNCGFIGFTGEDLMEMTRENYFTDEAGPTLRKTADDGSYKSWYSEYYSFDRDGEALGTWKRIFVYPKATQNEYFNKYDVADAKFARETESYSVLDFFKKDIVVLKEYDNTGVVINNEAYFLDENGEPGEVAVIPGELEPLEREGINVMFENAKYYQAIEAQFPEFYELLAFRGSLKYDTFKEMMISRESLPEEEKEILRTLASYRSVTKEYVDNLLTERQGVDVENPDLAEKLVIVADGDAALEAVRESASPEKVEPIEEEETTNTLLYLLLTTLALILTIVIVVFAMRKKDPDTNITNE